MHIVAHICTIGKRIAQLCLCVPGLDDRICKTPRNENTMLYAILPLPNMKTAIFVSTKVFCLQRSLTKPLEGKAGTQLVKEMALTTNNDLSLGVLYSEDV